MRLSESYGVAREDFLKQYMGGELDPRWLNRVSKLSAKGWKNFVAKEKDRIKEIRGMVHDLAAQTGVDGDVAGRADASPRNPDDRPRRIEFRARVADQRRDRARERLGGIELRDIGLGELPLRVTPARKSPERYCVPLSGPCRFSSVGLCATEKNTCRIWPSDTTAGSNVTFTASAWRVRPALTAR